MYFLLLEGVLCLSLFCYVLLCVHSSFAIILKRKLKPVALLLFSYRCIVTINVLWLFVSAEGWSAVCDCGISWLYSLTFYTMSGKHVFTVWKTVGILISWLLRKQLV